LTQYGESCYSILILGIYLEVYNHELNMSGWTIIGLQTIEYIYRGRAFTCAKAIAQTFLNWDLLRPNKTPPNPHQSPLTTP